LSFDGKAASKDHDEEGQRLGIEIIRQFAVDEVCGKRFFSLCRNASRCPTSHRRSASSTWMEGELLTTRQPGVCSGAVTRGYGLRDNIFVEAFLIEAEKANLSEADEPAATGL